MVKNIVKVFGTPSIFVILNLLPPDPVVPKKYVNTVLLLKSIGGIEDLSKSDFIVSKIKFQSFSVSITCASGLALCGSLFAYSPLLILENGILPDIKGKPSTFAVLSITILI